MSEIVRLMVRPDLDMSMNKSPTINRAMLELAGVVLDFKKSGTSSTRYSTTNTHFNDEVRAKLGLDIYWTWHTDWLIPAYQSIKEVNEAFDRGALDGDEYFEMIKTLNKD